MKASNENIANACKALDLSYDCLSSGPITAEIAIVSDYPGETEARTKLPFSGKTGKYLWAALERYKITQKDVYCTNVVKRLSDENTPVSRSEFSLYTEVLETELGSMPNLKYVLCLGTNALHALAVSGASITDCRGSVYHWRQAKTFHTYNPAYVTKQDKMTGNLLDPLLEVIFAMDLAKFNKLLKGEYAPDVIETDVITSYDRFTKLMDDLERKANDSPICLDIEHVGPYTGCVGLCAGDNVGYVIPFCTKTENIYSFEDELRVRHRLSEFMQLPQARIIGQYVATDLCWLWYKDGIGPCPPVWGDTLLAHHLLYPTLPHNLAFLVSQYTWNPFYKDEGSEWKLTGDFKTHWEYNAKDTVNTYNIHEILLKTLESNTLVDIYRNHVTRLTKHLCTATVCGVKIDTELKAKLRVDYLKSMETDKAVLEDFALQFYENEAREAYLATPPEKRKLLSSPDQLGKLIYERMNAPLLSRRTKKGAYPTDKITLKKLAESNVVSDEHKKFYNNLLSLRQKSKFLSTYVDVKVDEDDKFRPFYKQQGVKTAPGRLSSEHNQWHTASNIQNHPEQSRAMFIAPEGYCFVYIDGSQAEARFVAWDADIPHRKADFERARLNPGSFDCHRALASQMFNVPYDDVPHKDYNPDGTPTIRWLGKRAGHGLNYRMMPPTFAERTGISLVQAHNVFEIYHRLMPQLQAWWKRIEDEIRRTKKQLGYGLLTNPFGRRLVILERLTQEAMAAIVAFRPQSSIGDLLQKTWYMSHDDDDWPHDARIIINVHDSLTALCPIAKTETVASIMIKHAETPIMVNGEPLIIPAEAKVSVPDEFGVHRWSNLKDFKLAA